MTSNYKAASERTDEAERLLTSAVPQTQSAQHAPGPWTTERLHAKGNEGKIAVMNGSEYIAIIDAVEGSEKNKANAQLIAAAPELLTLTIQFRDYVASTHPKCKLVNDLNAAIAKAEGRTN